MTQSYRGLISSQPVATFNIHRTLLRAREKKVSFSFISSFPAERRTREHVVNGIKYIHIVLHSLSVSKLKLHPLNTNSPVPPSQTLIATFLLSLSKNLTALCASYKSDHRISVLLHMAWASQVALSSVQFSRSLMSDSS